MKFVTDLNKGILGSPDSEELWSAIINQIPNSVLKKPNVRILCVAAGHATEAVILARRMLALGVNKKSVNESIWLIDKYQVFAHEAKIVRGFKNVVTDDFLIWNPNMEFDVIVGNPPFKNGNEVGGKSSLWRKIVAKSWSILKDDGYIAMISPQLPNTANDLGDIFTKHQTLTVWTKIEHHFPNIGSSFRAWIVNKSLKKYKTKFINEGIDLDLTNKQLPDDLKSISIIDKFLANDTFKCVSSAEYYHTSVADGKNDDHMFSKPSKKHPYKLRRTSGDNYYIFGAVEPSDYYTPKVTMTFSGNPHYQYHDKNNPIGTIKYQSGHIVVKNKKEGENLIALYQTKLYRFVQGQISKGGMKGSVYYSLPKLDLSRKWTDTEIYKQFKLTKAEIECVESLTK
jgi:hypothetical protein